MRDNLRDFVRRHAASDEDRLSLIRLLAPRILITGAFQFNELYELEPRMDLAQEYIGPDWPTEGDALTCITIRAFSVAGHDSQPYQVMRDVAIHLRAVLAGAQSEIALDVLRDVYIEPAEAPAWEAAAGAWRELRGSSPSRPLDGLPLTGSRAESHSSGPAAPKGPQSVWPLHKPASPQSYNQALYASLKAMRERGEPRPTAAAVLRRWQQQQPTGILLVTDKGFKYENADGVAKEADLEALRKAIGRMTRADD